MRPQSRRLIHHAHRANSGGSTLLSWRMWCRFNWRVTPIDALAGLDIVLLGAGWYQDQHAPDPYSRWMLRSLLSRDHLHSIRALRMLASIGITNAVNTGSIGGIKGPVDGTAVPGTPPPPLLPPRHSADNQRVTGFSAGAGRLSRGVPPAPRRQSNLRGYVLNERLVFRVTTK
jgi:hypothetical protein